MRLQEKQQEGGRGKGELYIMNTYDLIYCAVKQIPRGQVASYSQIAGFGGKPQMGQSSGVCPELLSGFF